MAEKHQQVYPLAPANGQTRSDDTEMSNSETTKELKRKKRIKISIYIAIFAIFQLIVIAVFGLVVMRARSPKLRLINKDFTFQKLDTKTTPSPSFDMRFTAEIRVKNPNFGPYKYDDTTVTFTYGGVTVGQVIIPKGKAGIKGSKKVNVDVSLDSKKLSDTVVLGGELNNGIVTLTSVANMKGKAELMYIMKKKKSGEMNCKVVVDVQRKALKGLECK